MLLKVGSEEEERRRGGEEKGEGKKRGREREKERVVPKDEGRSVGGLRGCCHPFNKRSSSP